MRRLVLWLAAAGLVVLALGLGHVALTTAARGTGSLAETARGTCATCHH